MLSLLKIFDREVFFAVHGLQKFHLDLLLAWPTYLGSLKAALPLLFVLTLIQSRSKFVLRFLSLAFPIVLAHELVEWLKAFFKIQRPFAFYKNTPDIVNVIFEKPENFSFPSGHACTAFSLAMIAVSIFKMPPAAAYAFAILVGLTRMYVGVHFPSDLIAGAVIGLLVTGTWLRFFHARLFNK